MACARAVLRSKWLRIGGTLAGITFLVHNVDMGKAGRSLMGADWRWAVLGLALTAVACLASVFEWGVLLRSSAGLGVRSPVDHAEGHQQADQTEGHSHTQPPTRNKGRSPHSL